MSYKLFTYTQAIFKLHFTGLILLYCAALKPDSSPRRNGGFLVVSSYKPTLCGIATYAEHFSSALGKIGVNMDVLRVKKDDPVEEGTPAPEVVYTLNGTNSRDYVKAAAWVVRYSCVDA